MARSLRIEFEGALYHVMARGNARSDIFVDDDDRQLFVDNLGRVSRRFDWRVWAEDNRDTHLLRIQSNFGTLGSESVFTKARSGKFGRLNATSDQFLPRSDAR